jgi:hypothetical protein
MNLQYILDSKGETTGVFIPIQEWLSFKKKFKNSELETTAIPEAHKAELDERLENIKNGTSELHDFDKAMDDIEKGL